MDNTLCRLGLVLVNSENRIPRDWDIEFTELRNGQKVDSRIYPDLQAMFDDMRSQGIYPRGYILSNWSAAKRRLKHVRPVGRDVYHSDNLKKASVVDC